MKGDDEFIKIGAAHAAAGQPRYKFKDPYLQKLYDEGYNLNNELKDLVEKRRHNNCRRCGVRILPEFTYCNGCL
jgi:hypothetical protein